MSATAFGEAVRSHWGSRMLSTGSWMSLWRRPQPDARRVRRGEHGRFTPSGAQSPRTRTKPAWTQSQGKRLKAGWDQGYLLKSSPPFRCVGPGQGRWHLDTPLGIGYTTYRPSQRERGEQKTHAITKTTRRRRRSTLPHLTSPVLPSPLLTRREQPGQAWRDHKTAQTRWTHPPDFCLCFIVSISW